MSELNLTHSNGNKVKLTTPDTLAASKTFKLPGIDGSEGQVLQTDGSGALSFASKLTGNQNMVINGGMTISQRYGTSEYTPNQNSTYNRFALDMMRYDLSQTSKFKVQQVTDAPAGFSYSMKVTSLSAYTSNETDYFLLQNMIEGRDIARLDWGTANAQPVTLSFYVKSSITGVHACGIRNRVYNRAITQTYTINNANTWEYKTVTFIGDTSGSWDVDTQAGLKINFDLGSGSGFEAASTGTWLGTNDFITSDSVKVLATNGATWYITGLQLQVGNIATPFEHLSFADELRHCQRYFTFVPSGTVFPGRGNSSSSYIYSYQAPVPMRASPTIGISNDLAHGTFSMRRYRDGTGVSDSNNTPTTNSTYFQGNTNMIHLIQGGFSGADDRSATLFLSGGAILIHADLD